MTWKHVALILVAALLVLGCGVSHVCSAPGTLSGVLQLATTIVGGALGHAGTSALVAKSTDKPAA